MSHQDAHPSSVKASEVLKEELEHIRRRRQQVYNLDEDEVRVDLPSAATIDEDLRLTKARLKVLDEHLVGLSFSGGGIRSGTFAVGILQGLAHLGLLRRIDYLSTVSGGGYAGSWLAAWLKRAGDVRDVERQLSPSRVRQAGAPRAFLPPFDDGSGPRDRVVDDEPTPVFHLRQYSSYLFPRFGFLTADTWTVIAIWLRNVTINLMMLVPMALALVLVARMVVALYGYAAPAAVDIHPLDDFWTRWGYTVRWVLFGLGAVALIAAFLINAYDLEQLRERAAAEVAGRAPPPARPGRFARLMRWIGDARGRAYWMQPLLLVAAVLLTIPLRALVWGAGDVAASRATDPAWRGNALANVLLDYLSSHLGLLDVPNVVLLHGLPIGLLIALVVAVSYPSLPNRRIAEWVGVVAVFGLLGGGALSLVTPTWPQFGIGFALAALAVVVVTAARVAWKDWTLWKYLSSAFAAGFTGGVLLTLVEVLIRELDRARWHELVAAIGPPLALLVIVAAVVVEVALMGRDATEAEREWWARFSALLLITAILWLVALATVIYVPAGFLYARGPLRLALTSGWLGATAFGILSGRYALPRRTGGSTLAAIAAYMPPIFLIGLIGLVALVASALVNMPPVAFPARGEEEAAVALYFKGVREAPFWGMALWALLALILSRMAARLIDVNLFSLHAMYANRLIRCYLGASRPMGRWAGRWGGRHNPASGAGAPSLSGDDGPPGPRDLIAGLRAELAWLAAKQKDLEEQVGRLADPVGTTDADRNILGQRIAGDRGRLEAQVGHLEVLAAQARGIDPGEEDLKRREKELDERLADPDAVAKEREQLKQRLARLLKDADHTDQGEADLAKLAELDAREEERGRLRRERDRLRARGDFLAREQALKEQEATGDESVRSRAEEGLQRLRRPIDLYQDWAKRETLDDKLDKLGPADRFARMKLDRERGELTARMERTDRRMKEELRRDRIALLAAWSDWLDVRAKREPRAGQDLTWIADDKARIADEIRGLRSRPDIRTLREDLEQLDGRIARLKVDQGWERRKLEEERRLLRIDLAGAETGQLARDANEVTGFDLTDDIPLVDLRIGSGSRVGRAYWGPHLLINTTLNLVAGQELAWRDRKGESFTLTPLRCGSKSVGYAGVTPVTRRELTLGRAITISGAAVDPNMSFYQSPALTAFLTIFNARLGYWMQNPLFPNWTAEGPKFGDRLWAELLGRTDNKDEFVHLSDGGHFENLGVYELVRRRCRYIIAVDAGEDIDASDDNLSILVRLCRIDFGVRIELDTRPMVESGPDKLAGTHVVIGRVHYEDVDNGQMPGILVYVKISLTGDEPSDVQKYAKTDPRFPHQPTDLRQSFDEEQFECYRALGFHIARDVFAEAVARVGGDGTWKAPAGRDDYIRGNQRLFSALRGRWAAPPAEHDAHSLQSAREWVQLQREIRTEPALADLSRELYPELAPSGDGTAPAPAVPIPAPPPSPDGPERRRAELHAAGQMLKIMEDAWMNLGLKGHSDLPVDRGWMNVFRRWTSTESLRRLWPTLRPEFSPDFVAFCEQQLHLGVAGRPWSLRLPAQVAPGSFEERSIRGLNERFRREWPGEAWPVVPGSEAPPSRDLEALLGSAVALGKDLKLARPLAWLIVQAPSGEEPAAEAADERFACGIVLVCRARDYRTVADGAYPTFRGAYELVAWVRRPYRSTGLGSGALREILEPIRRELGENDPSRPLVLWTRYPKPEREGEADAEQATWKSFFALYDFRPVIQPEGARQSLLQLELRRSPEMVP